VANFFALRKLVEGGGAFDRITGNIYISCPQVGNLVLLENICPLMNGKGGQLGKTYGCVWQWTRLKEVD
jgi:hypothetical protein